MNDELLLRFVVAVERIADALEQKTAKKQKTEPRTYVIPPQAYDIASYLAEIVERNGGIISSRDVSLKSWARYIEKLNRVDGISYDMIESAMKFHEKHYGEKYHPVIKSGKSLRDKWDKLYNAMERTQELPLGVTKKGIVIK